MPNLDFEITPEIILKAYAAGIFPMAEDADDPGLFWVDPQFRGIIPIDDFHFSRRLARTVRSDHFSVRSNQNFEGVISGCAQSRMNGEKTWINERIRNLYSSLFELGCCHTIEVYNGDQLVGGLYGITLGSAFFGESMFHTERDASKVALVHLVARLKRNNFTLLDTQFVTDHLAGFGAIEIPRRRYKDLLQQAISQHAEWDKWPGNCSISGTDILSILI